MLPPWPANVFSSIRAKLIGVFVLIKLIPLVLLALFAWWAAEMFATIKRVGDAVTDDARRALDDRSREAIETLTTDTAQAIAAFLHDRDHDILHAAQVKPRVAAYRDFVASRQRALFAHGPWLLSDDGKRWLPASAEGVVPALAAKPVDALADNARDFHARPPEYRSLRTRIEAGLRDAVREQRFLLYYQAQVDSVGRLIGAEILLRWPHAERSMIPPAEFIPLAEETGLIVPLGERVLETACAQVAAWSGEPDAAHLILAANVSARPFRLPDFVAQTLAIFHRSGANPHRLKLELTESMLLASVDDVIAKMGALKAHGVSFSLDDFGTGFSSLA